MPINIKLFDGALEVEVNGTRTTITVLWRTDRRVIDLTPSGCIGNTWRHSYCRKISNTDIRYLIEAFYISNRSLKHDDFEFIEADRNVELFVNWANH